MLAIHWGKFIDLLYKVSYLTVSVMRIMKNTFLRPVIDRLL